MPLDQVIPQTRCMSAQKRRHSTKHAPNTLPQPAPAQTIEPVLLTKTTHPRSTPEKGKVDRRSNNGSAGYRFS